MVDGVLYDEICYYNKNGTMWIHSQVVPFKTNGADDSHLTNFYKAAYEFIIEKNIAEFEITETGEYTFEAFDNFDNKVSKTIQIEI